MIKGLLDYLTGRAPLKRTPLDKEKEIETYLVEKVNRLEIRLHAEKQRADGLLKEVESWKAAALKADKDMKDATQKQKKTPPCRVTGKGKQIRSTGATGKGVKLNKQ